MTIIYARNYLSSFLFKCLTLTRNDFEWYLLPLPNSKTVLRWAWWVDLPKYSLWIMIIDSCKVFNKFFNWLKVVNFCGIFLQKFFLLFWREKTICNICKIKTLKIFMLQSSISTWGVCEWVQCYKKHTFFELFHKWNTTVQLSLQEGFKVPYYASKSYWS